MDINEFEEFRPLDFFQLANELNENMDKFNSSSSSVKRNIFGRIYYSVFLFVREWLLGHTNYKSHPKDDHSKIPKYIRMHGPFSSNINMANVNKGRRMSSNINMDISRKIETLKKLRHQSDYYIEVPPLYSYEYSNWTFKDISYALALAEDIFVAFGG